MIAISSRTSRATDQRVAPIARRSASSPPRDVTCASVRLAILHDAISSSTSTAQKQHDERRAEVAVLPVAKGEEAAGPALMRARQLAREIARTMARDLGVRLLERRPVGELRDRHDVGACLVDRRRLRDAERRPELRREKRRRKPRGITPMIV